MQERRRKRRRPTHQEAVELFQDLRRKYGVRQREIAAATGLNQGAVSKILRGSFKTVEGRAYQVWKYASQRTGESQHERPSRRVNKADPRLTDKITEVWDRT